MTRSLRDRLLAAVAAGPLAERLAAALPPLVERRGEDAAARRLDGPALRGLARAIASQPETAGFLSRRPALLERIATADAESLEARGRALERDADAPDPGDLEAALDAMRLLRREETCLAACLDLGGALPFEAISRFLSILAEAIARRALRLACRGRAAESGRPALSVVGMGKIAGREFTFHSDLDLIFLYQGGADDIVPASRIGQRMISYLTTMTGAGVAYAVDTRLRPSGEQGMLVTSHAAFDRYQCERAETWEHLAMLRARPLAGAIEPAQRVLEHVRQVVLARPQPPWEALSALRLRVERERARDSEERLAFKTGPGGMMDVDFLAGGGVLERGARPFPPLPSVAAMLALGARGPRVDALLADYGFLRRLEARARWTAGRGVETLPIVGEAAAVVAELMEPGLTAQELRRRVTDVRARVRSAWEAVVSQGSIRALKATAAARRASGERS